MGPKWVRLAPNGTNLGLLKIIFQYILAHRAKMYWKSIFKVPDLSHLVPIWSPYGPNMISLLVIRYRAYHIWGQISVSWIFYFILFFYFFYIVSIYFNNIWHVWFCVMICVTLNSYEATHSFISNTNQPPVRTSIVVMQRIVKLVRLRMCMQKILNLNFTLLI